MKFRYLTALVLLFFFPLSLWALTLSDETKYGQESYLELVASARLYSDPYVSIQMGIIKRRLETVSDLPFPIKLSIMESDTLDAFATTGGYVYVTTGILEQADKEEEIAGVLAHEFTHVGRRHVAKSIEKDKYVNWGMLGAMLLGMLAPSAAGKAAIMTTGMGAGQTIALKHSREFEDEADAGGVAKAEAAGYNGAGSAEFLKKIASTGLEKMLPQYLLTHPYSEARVIRIRQMASPAKTRVDVSLFPFVVARLRILGKPVGAQNEDIWLHRYNKDPKDAVGAYGAALVYSLKGDWDRALAIAKAIDSPHRSLFVGEFLVTGHRFSEAIAVLENETHPVARYYLAKAYEGQGDLATAGGILGELAPYGDTFPDVYQRMGMVFGRQGNEAGGYEYLGRYYFETGRFPAAKVNLEKAISKYGMNSGEAQEILKLLDRMKPEKEKKKKSG
ncbi:MAG: M48 family metalloprotease [Syntrophorhabdales bacterium]